MAQPSIHGPSKDEMLRYQAEDMAMTAMKEMPEYKKMVETMLTRLKGMKKEAQGMMGKRMPLKKGTKTQYAGMANVAPPGVAR